MQFLIADTFTDSLGRLTAQEQKAVKTTAFDLQVDPSNPGMQLHRLNKCKDPNFWSVRVSRDIRVIVHKTKNNFLLCFVAHHDDAYDWAVRRRIETHPRTGAAQIVELRERVEEIPVYRPVEKDGPVVEMQPLFSNLDSDLLLGIGVPADWLEDVRLATEDSLFDLAPHLPQEAVEALLDIAVGAAPRTVAEPDAAPVLELAVPEDAITPEPESEAFEHPDAQRRFRPMANAEELERALDFPWEKWTVFLHPTQRRFVERGYNGPARISGSAGTGKTIVALHRAVFLARSRPGARVLLTTFSSALARNLKVKLDRLAGNEPNVASRIGVETLQELARRLHEELIGEVDIAPDHVVSELLEDAALQVSDKFSMRFLIGEWNEVVDAWQIADRESYRTVQRLGRKTRIGGAQRETLWTIFEHVREGLHARTLMTWPGVFGALVARGGSEAFPCDFAVIDEAQDVSVAELRYLSTLAGRGSDSLFFAGDLGQRIFRQPFSWASLGIDIRGRSHTLRINYRTSQEIRSRADRLLPSAISDVDGIEETRSGTISLFNGPAPVIRTFADADAETDGVARWLGERLADGVRPEELGVFVREDGLLDRAKAAVSAAAAQWQDLGDTSRTGADAIAIGTMHLAKGLEFRGVAVIACDDEVLPLQSRLEEVGDESDLQEVYDTERHLLYVACTRAREHLLVTGVHPASEFLDDMEARSS